MTPSTETTSVAASSRKRPGSLNSMLVADLKAMAGALGVAGAPAMKKPQLVEAIKAVQNEHAATQGGMSRRPVEQAAQPDERRSNEQGENRSAQDKSDQNTGDQNKGDQNKGDQHRSDRNQGQQDGQKKKGQQKKGQQNSGSQSSGPQSSGPQSSGPAKSKQGKQSDADKQQDQSKQDPGSAADDGDDGSRRNRRRRGRDRNRPGTLRSEPDTQILEDDVLVPAAGILDVLDNYAFVRTSGYVAGGDDVYLSLSMVRKFGLRRGDAVVGQVRQPREGERREKFNPMVRVDNVNGAEPDRSRERVEFDELTPIHPTAQLRLETAPDDVVGRTIDLVAPMGKGQRGLVIAPSRAGRTEVMRSVADSISANNPECHLMVVVLDERPEEVTEYQRSVKGEVIASTFDRAASDATALAELAIDRARRLVELGHDVVVLIDGITRLGRAYNMSAPANGRTLADGVDASAIAAPKRFFGAARNLEAGGSLTILATVTVDSGSKVDELIFEEIRDTANMELWLRRDAAEGGHFPAVDVGRSGTRHEEHLVGRETLLATTAWRRRVRAEEPLVSLETLQALVRETDSNADLLHRLP